MKKHNWKQILRQWDEGRFDLTMALPEQTEPDHAGPDLPYRWDRRDRVRALERRELRLFERMYPWLSALLCVVIVLWLFWAVAELPAFGDPQAPAHNQVMERYVGRGTQETGAVNTVAGVILDYRAFDTLGESHVLFAAATAVLVLLMAAGKEDGEYRRELAIMHTESILRNTVRVIVPVVLLFGLYVMFNGHLGPGGGFSGGAVLGAGLILYAISFGFDAIERFLNFRSYRATVLVSLCFYSLAKCYAFFCGANHLPVIFSAGTPGRIFSAGLILPLNLAVGLIVACTMYGFYSVFKRGRI